MRLTQSVLAVLVLALAGCPAPPPVEIDDAAVDTDAVEPTIEILYPESGQQIELDERCMLDEPLIVNVTGLDLVSPAERDVIEGEGHWHGGPSLDQGYCMAWVAFCNGGDPQPGYYDGTGMVPGLLTLFASIQDNEHEPLGTMTDQVEIELTDPNGFCR